MYPTKTLPWVSILAQENIGQADEKPQLLLIKMLAKVSLEAINFYNTGAYKELDALIGNSGCETHAFNMLCLAHSEELQAEIKVMQGKCQSILDKTVEKIRNKRIISDPQFSEEVQQVVVSEKMVYLIQARLLTITKKDEVTDANMIVSKIGRDLHGIVKVINKIVVAAQVHMSELSIALMAAKLDEISLADRLVKVMLSEVNLRLFTANKKFYSCCFYNTKAVLLLAAKLKTPLVFKRMAKEVNELKTLIFKPTEMVGKFEVVGAVEPRAPVIVCDVELPDNDRWIDNVEKLEEMILIDASKVDQYVRNHPEIEVTEPEAIEEIQSAKEKTAPFHIDHFYCTTWENI